jgi:O-antigen ligase
VFSLNRGLWLGLAVMAVYVAARLAWNGRILAIQVLVIASVVGGAVFVSTPLFDTVILRLETPHSNDRRLNTAEQVVVTTWEGSPIVGYGSTREMEGSFASLAGGGTPDCPQCAPPPLGTQGFMWRLILTTGFVGTALTLSFLAVQFWRHMRGLQVYSVIGCALIVTSGLLFFVYDSLESPFFTLMIAIGLMSRERLHVEGSGEPVTSRPELAEEPT